MPSYEYQCEKCGFVFEREQSITAAPLKECQECKGALKRLINASGGFILKGAGGAGAACDADACAGARLGGVCCGASHVACPRC